MVERTAHVGKTEHGAMLDAEWWRARWSVAEWQAILDDQAEREPELRAIREATYTGRPLGSSQFVAGLEEKLGRQLEARPGGKAKQASNGAANQLAFWSAE